MSKNKLNTLNKKYIKQRNKEVKALSEIKSIEKQMINEVIFAFQNKNERDGLIADAKLYHFSSEKLKHIERVFANFNQDEIAYNDIEDIMDASKHIEEHRGSENNNNDAGLFSKIGNALPEDDSECET